MSMNENEFYERKFLLNLFHKHRKRLSKRAKRNGHKFGIEPELNINKLRQQVIKLQNL